MTVSPTAKRLTAPGRLVADRHPAAEVREDLHGRRIRKPPSKAHKLLWHHIPGSLQRGRRRAPRRGRPAACCRSRRWRLEAGNEVPLGGQPLGHQSQDSLRVVLWYPELLGRKVVLPAPQQRVAVSVCKALCLQALPSGARGWRRRDGEARAMASGNVARQAGGRIGC